MLLLAVAVRLALDGGQRRPAFHLICASIICLLVTDFAYGLMILHGTYDHQLWLDAGWIGFYLLWGAAALHPSMSEIDEPAVKRGELLTRFRLALLTGASLIAPTMGMVHDLSVGDYDFAVVRAASITLFGLVILRMAGLMRQQERSLERERMLSASGTDLVAATGRDEINGVALSAGRALSGPDFVTLVHPVASLGPVEVALLDAAREGDVVRLRAETLAVLGVPPDHNRVLRARPRATAARAQVARRRRADGAAGDDPHVAACARLPGGAGTRARHPHRGGAPAPRRGSLRIARAPCERPDHRNRAGRDDLVPEPFDRAAARLCAGGGHRPPVRGARPRLGWRARARAARGRRIGDR